MAHRAVLVARPPLPLVAQPLAYVVEWPLQHNKTVLTLTAVKDWSNLAGTGAMEMQA